MDEIQYRDTYHSVNERRCHFEKTVNARVCACRHMQRFNLADREGVGCAHPEAHQNCADWLRVLRQASCFALSQPNPVDILPHRLEAKVQAGGLLGLSELIDGAVRVEDIASLLDRSLERYGDVSDIPLQDIVTAVTEYEPRRRKIPSPKSALLKAQKAVQEKTSGVASLADELIAERRAEAQREADE